MVFSEVGSTVGRLPRLPALFPQCQPRSPTWISLSHLSETDRSKLGRMCSGVGKKCHPEIQELGLIVPREELMKSLWNGFSPVGDDCMLHDHA